jgi:hypothetical protein
MDRASASRAVDGLGPVLVAFLRPCAGQLARERLGKAIALRRKF